jgi:hypothetical protein
MPWATHRLEAPGRPAIGHRHAVPPRSAAQPADRGRRDRLRPGVGGQEDGVLWISGDTVLYDGVREVARRLDVNLAILHLGRCGSG